MGKTQNIRIALAQVNPTVGALKNNSNLVVKYAKKAMSQGAQVVLFPELVITGYPPEDLLLKSKFVDDNLDCLKSIAEKVKGITAIVGFVDRAGSHIHNGAAVLSGGSVKGVYHKRVLPNYGVFDEERYFKKGNRPMVIDIGDIRAGICICEDLWEGAGILKKQSTSKTLRQNLLRTKLPGRK